MQMEVNKLQIKDSVILTKKAWSDSNSDMPPAQVLNPTEPPHLRVQQYSTRIINLCPNFQRNKPKILTLASPIPNKLSIAQRFSWIDFTTKLNLYVWR